MKSKAFVIMFAVLMVPIIIGCTCGLDNFTDYLYSDPTVSPPTPTPGLYIPVSDSKQPPCSMQWLSESASLTTGPYALDVSSQAGATTYEFVITYPDGTQVLLKSPTSDATLKMNELPVGVYAVEVRAIDLMGEQVCAIQAGFTKPGAGFALNTSPQCAMKFVSPADGSELPIDGPVNFGWTLQSGAQTYVLDFILPNGNHGMADPTTNLSKTMYMEAFEPGGTYTVFVKAFNAESNMICQVSTTFTKAQHPQQLAKPIQQNNNDEPAAPTQGSPFFPPIIVLNFTPTPVVHQ